VGAAVVAAVVGVVDVVDMKRSWLCVLSTSNGCVITAAITAAVAPDKRLTVLTCVDDACVVCNVCGDVDNGVVDDDGDDDVSAAVYMGLNASKQYQYRAE